MVAMVIYSVLMFIYSPSIITNKKYDCTHSNCHNTSCYPYVFCKIVQCTIKYMFVYHTVGLVPKPNRQQQKKANLIPLTHKYRGPGGLMSQVVGSNNSYKPITNTAWVRAQFCKLQKGCTRLAAASDKVYQLFAHGRWFSPASSTTKSGRHDIADILLKVALNTNNLKKSLNQ